MHYGADGGVAYSPDSFNAVGWDYAGAQGNWIFAHEMGHNLGAWHETGNIQGLPPYCHAYVHATTPAFRTIVATVGPNRIQHYSNPDVSYSGVWTGTPDAGAAPSANNARCIRVYAPASAGEPPVGRGRLSDCNLNGTCDVHEIAVGTSHDCNNNGVPDECDIASETSIDCDENGVPDECQYGACCLYNYDCVQAPTSVCCDAAGGVHWYGPYTHCRNIDCLEGPMGPQGP